MWLRVMQALTSELGLLLLMSSLPLPVVLLQCENGVKSKTAAQQTSVYQLHFMPSFLLVLWVVSSAKQHSNKQQHIP
jgi:hypothetical protein